MRKFGSYVKAYNTQLKSNNHENFILIANSLFIFPC